MPSVKYADVHFAAGGTYAMEETLPATKWWHTDARRAGKLS